MVHTLCFKWHSCLAAIIIHKKNKQLYMTSVVYVGTGYKASNPSLSICGLSFILQAIAWSSETAQQLDQ